MNPTRVRREHAVGADRLQPAGRRRPLHAQRPGAPALPVVDLESMHTGLQRDGLSPDGQFGRDHDLVVHPHDHAIVGAGPKLDSFRARGEPDAAPANEVVPVRQVPFGDERQVQAHGPIVDARDDRGVECGRGRIAVEGIVVLAFEPCGGRQGCRQLPERRQRDCRVQKPPAPARDALEQLRPAELSAHLRIVSPARAPIQAPAGLAGRVRRLPRRRLVDETLR